MLLSHNQAYTGSRSSIAGQLTQGLGRPNVVEISLAGISPVQANPVMPAGVKIGRPCISHSTAWAAPDWVVHASFSGLRWPTVPLPRSALSLVAPEFVVAADVDDTTE
jgi:hypothetical protein